MFKEIRELVKKIVNEIVSGRELCAYYDGEFSNLVLVETKSKE